MRLFGHTLLMTGLILITLGLLLFVSNEYIGWQRDKLSTEIKWESRKLELEMKKACQGFAATATDEEWGYKSCLKELKLNKEIVKEL